MKTPLHRHVRNVHRGARWLDKRMPDWYLQINLTTLALEDETRCVLGQLADSLLPGADFDTVVAFPDGCIFPQLKALDGMKSDKDVTRHGFDVEEDTDDAYDYLNTAWREEILMRRRLHG